MVGISKVFQILELVRPTFGPSQAKFWSNFGKIQAKVQPEIFPKGDVTFGLTLSLNWANVCVDNQILTLSLKNRPPPSRNLTQVARIWRGFTKGQKLVPCTPSPGFPPRGGGH